MMKNPIAAIGVCALGCWLALPSASCVAAKADARSCGEPAPAGAGDKAAPEKAEAGQAAAPAPAGSAEGQAAPPKPSETSGPAAQPVEQAKVDPDVDRLLAKAEKAGEETKWLETDFDSDYNQTLVGDEEWRTGRMVYKKPSCVYIEYTDGSKDKFRFDGRVYVEDRPAPKRGGQRYVHIFRKPGAPPIPVLDIDELPFPHPFGQKRERLLADYTVQYKGKEKLGPWKRPPEKGETQPAAQQPPDEKEYEHLVLTPKKKSEKAREYKGVEYWLDGDTGLVRQLRTEDHSERILTVRFKNLKTNEAVKADDRLFEKGPLPSGWEEAPPIDHTEEAEGKPEGTPAKN